MTLKFDKIVFHFFKFILVLEYQYILKGLMIFFMFWSHVVIMNESISCLLEYLLQPIHLLSLTAIKKE